MTLCMWKNRCLLRKAPIEMARKQRVLMPFDAIKLHWNWNWHHHTQSLSCWQKKNRGKCSSSCVFQSGFACVISAFLLSKVFPVLLMLLRTQATINVEKCKSLSDLVNYIVGCLIGCLFGWLPKWCLHLLTARVSTRSSSARAGHAEKASPRQVRKGRAQK